MSGRAPKQKGTRIEREVVMQFTEAQLRAKRTWGSSGKSMGLPHNVDVLVEDDIRVQVKAKKKLPKEMTEALDDTDILIYREDGGRTLAMVRLPLLIELMKLGLPVERDLIFKEYRDEQNIPKKKTIPSDQRTPEESGEQIQGAEQAETPIHLRTGLQLNSGLRKSNDARRQDGNEGVE